jgi:hypothetical protein
MSAVSSVKTPGVLVTMILRARGGQVDMLDPRAEIGDQAQIGASLGDHVGVDPVGDRGDEDMGFAHGLDQGVVRHRAILGIEGHLEQLGHPALCFGQKATRDDHARFAVYAAGEAQVLRASVLWHPCTSYADGHGGGQAGQRAIIAVDRASQRGTGGCPRPAMLYRKLARASSRRGGDSDPCRICVPRSVLPRSALPLPWSSAPGFRASPSSLPGCMPQRMAPRPTGPRWPRTRPTCAWGRAANTGSTGPMCARGSR